MADQPTLPIDGIDPRPASSEDVPEDQVYAYCLTCWRYTTLLEAQLRIFNPGHCGHCGGDLKAVRYLGDR